MPTNFITLSRSALYDLVWTKPVRDVAKDFGISDVALAKRCRALKIPLPPRGYWAKVSAGQHPRRPKLPPFTGDRTRGHVPTYVATRDKQGPLDEPTVAFTPKPAPATPETSASLSPEEAALRARIDALDITPLDTLTSAHPAVLRTARLLKRPWRKDISWARGTQRGSVLQVSNVSEPQTDRALRVLDTVLRAADAMGWNFEAPPPKEAPTPRGRGYWGPKPPAPPVFGHLVVDGEPMQLKIDERRRQFDHVPTEKEKADKKAGRYVWMPRFDFEPSGELRLHLVDADSSLTRKTWKDTPTRPLETQAAKILHGLLDRALALKRDREEKRLRDIAWREQERQQAIVRQRRTANQSLIHELERQAGAWSRARLLRRYLRAARRATAPTGFFVKSADGPLDFLSWAEHYVDQLDPLHPAPRDPDLARERSFQYGADEKQTQEELRRLIGQTWESALKLVAAPTEDTEDDGED